MLISWYSAGVSSAVASAIAKPDRIIYIDIEDQEKDTYRFIRDCEQWFNKKIEILKSPLGSVENACLSASYIRGPAGAACTRLLKKRVRKEWEIANPGRHTYVWGVDSDEKDRAERIMQAMPQYDHLFPILDKTKQHVHGMLKAAGIKRPAMYDLGFGNNNCRLCLKGGMGYANKCRELWPDLFDRRAKMERRIGAHMLKECYLDELDPNRGREQKIIIPDCGVFCEINSQETISTLDDILS